MKRPITNEDLTKILEDMEKRATPFRGELYLTPAQAVTSILKIFELKG